MLNETHQKVVNTSNDMFDENYYRLTILGKGFIDKDTLFCNSKGLSEGKMTNLNTKWCLRKWRSFFI